MFKLATFMVCLIALVQSLEARKTLEISLRITGGDMVMNVTDQDLVFKVKEDIFLHTRMLPQYIAFYHDGLELDDEKTVMSYNFKERPLWIDVSPREWLIVDVEVHCPSGNNYNIEMNQYDEIYILKEKIQELEKIPYLEQRLFIGTYELPFHERFFDLQIANKTIITMVKRD